MARLPNGILGGIRGGIGQVEGYELNGQYIVRSKRRMTTKPPTMKQLATRQGMAVVNRFLSVCSPFVTAGYAWPAEGCKSPGYSLAVAYQLKHALSGVYPDLNIDYSKVLLARGPLPLPGVSATLQRDGQVLLFSWTPGEGGERATDHVMLLAYCMALHQVVYNLCGAKRFAGSETLHVPIEWTGEAIVCYLSFREENGIKCMDSVYLEG